MPLLLTYGLFFSLFWSFVPATKPTVPTPPVIDEWGTYPSMKSGVDGVAAAAIGQKLYVFGGSTNASHSSNNGVKAAAVLNVASRTWNPLPPMTSGRCYAPAVVWRDQIFVMGGLIDDEVLGEVEVYNTTGNFWHHTLALPTARCCMAVVVYRKEFYVLGGGDNRGIALDMIEIYNPKKNAWRQSEVAMTEPRTFFGAAAFEDSIIVVGGQVTYDARTCVQKYYPGKPQRGWVNLAAPQDAHRAFGSAVFGSFLFLVGGMAKDSGLEPTDGFEAYDMRRDTWFSLPHLPSPRDSATAVFMGKELVAVGGFGPTDRDGKVLWDVLHAKVQLPEGSGDDTGKAGRSRGSSAAADADAPGADRGPRKNHHLAWRLLVLLCFGGAVYAGGGAAMAYREGARGIELMPHLDFWMDMPALVMDGVAFFAAACVTLFDQAKGKFGPDRYEQLPDAEDEYL